jgi:hypothetical protein
MTERIPTKRQKKSIEGDIEIEDEEKSVRELKMRDIASICTSVLGHRS